MELRTKVSYSDEVTKRELENKQVAYQAAVEGIVLLENDGTLPIRCGKVALYGAGADMTIKGGTGSGEVNERHSTSIMEGLINAGFEITTKPWIDEYSDMYQKGILQYTKEFQKEIVKMDVIKLMANPYRYPFGREITDEDISNSNTDTCIYVIARQAGEGADRKLGNSDNNLSKLEVINIKKCANAYAKTIIVINAGSSFDTSFLDEISGINALIFFCQQGTEGGNAFADIISGKVSPSGRLSDTWAKRYEDIPFANEYSYLNGNLADEYYSEGIYVGYRYFDTFKVEPRYEFGYGLGYSEFSMSVTDVRVEKTGIKVKVSVKNTGNQFSGKEVVQLYVSCPGDKLEKEYQKLSAFVKTDEIKPHEVTEVEMAFDMSQLASYDEENSCYILEKGDYIIRVGSSSRKTKVCANIKLNEEVIISKHEKICIPTNNQLDKLNVLTKMKQSSETTSTEVLDGATQLSIDKNIFTTITYDYQTPNMYRSEKIDNIISKLSTKDMVDIVVGIGMIGGKKYFTVPGAVGYTTSKFTELGVPNVALSDGPAGLRLQKVSAKTKKGKIKMVEAMIDYINYLPKYMKKIFLTNPKKHTLVYQFTTAFPVEMALAQTWNVKLLEQVGQAIGVEMEEYGITYWLGPGLNIHRNPLCGRNFEYYSEDPLLTGKMAAATIKGVQSIAGNYATPKHYAANNQEDNRNKVSCNMSERTLREIYLRGFEIAVRESNPKSIMTSYNKINGTYAPNNYDLCTKALRNEWGFQGVVMTDWLSTGNNLANNSLAMSAGNDLIMPGTSADKKEIMKELRAGTISKDDLERCCRNVLKSVLESRNQI